MNRKEKGLLCIPLIVSILISIILRLCMQKTITINNFDIIAANYNNLINLPYLVAT